MSAILNIESQKPVLSIEAKVVTPVTQIDPSDEKDQLTKASVIKTKTRKQIRDNGRLENIPFFSANALRSMCRDVIARDIHAAMNHKGDRFSFTLPDLQAYTTGGGADADSITGSMTFGIEKRMREMSPFFSLFGIGLGGIEGKSAFSALVPSDDINVIGHTYGVRMDRTRDAKAMALVNEDDVSKWLEEQEGNRKANKDFRAASDTADRIRKAMNVARKNNEDTASLESELETAQEALNELTKGNMAFQQMYKYEYIVPGTTMHSCVTGKAGYALTGIEEGMLLRAMIGVALRQIGAMKAVGHGIVDWNVYGKTGEKLFSLIANPDYVFDRTLEISAEAQAKIDTYEKWLIDLDADLVSVKGIYNMASEAVKNEANEPKSKNKDTPDNLFG